MPTLGVWTGGLHKSRADLLQQLKRDRALGVGRRAVLAGVPESIDHGRLGHPFESGPLLEQILSEARPEMPSQCGPVGQEPGFHDLDHQKCPIVAGFARRDLLLPSAQVLPDRTSLLNGPLAVHEERRRPSRIGSRNRLQKELDGSVSRPAAHDPGQAPTEPRGSKELRPRKEGDRAARHRAGDVDDSVEQLLQRREEAPLALSPKVGQHKRQVRPVIGEEVGTIVRALALTTDRRSRRTSRLEGVHSRRSPIAASRHSRQPPYPSSARYRSIVASAAARSRSSSLSFRTASATWMRSSSSDVST